MVLKLIPAPITKNFGMHNILGKSKIARKHDFHLYDLQDKKKQQKE